MPTETLNQPDHPIEIERKIIHLMLKSRNVVDEMLEEGLATELFDPIHQPLVSVIYKEFVDSGQRRLLTRDAYRHSLIEQGNRADLMLSMGIYDKCYVGAFARPDDLGVLKKQLTEAHIARRSHFIFQEYAEECKKIGYVRAAQNLSEKFGSILNVMETRRTVFASVAESKEEWLKRFHDQRKNPESIVRCGIPEIDDSISVGFRAQHLTLFVADVGGHKTNLMLNVGLSLAEKGHGVLFIPLEMDRLDLINRIICNKAKIDAGDLSRPEKMPDDLVKKIEEAEAWMRLNNFYILDADERSSPSLLRREIEKRCMAFRPKVVIIDYADNLQSDILYGQRHIEIGEILKTIRFLGKKYGFHVMTAAQMGRSAIKSLREGKQEAVDSTAIHGSHQYSADSDTIFFLMKVKGEPDKIKVLVLKARHGPSGHIFELQVVPSQYRITSTHASVTLTVPTDVDNMMMQPMEDILSTSEYQASGPSFNLMGSFEEDDLADLG